MVIALDTHWIWDSWFVRDGGTWHAFFLQAPKSIGDPDQRHWNVSIGHATSTDLKDWRHLGTCLEPSEGPAFDDATTWTGSVIRGPDGLWHLFYTGTSKAEKALVQRIGHAVSGDLHDWRRVGDGPCLAFTGPGAAAYDTDLAATNWDHIALRDPWVMPDPAGDGWVMVLTARVPGRAEANDGGAIGLARSGDLYDWRLEPPLHSGGFGQLEVPQVFTRDGHWYCSFCTDVGHFALSTWASHPEWRGTGTHYLMAERFEGPWRLAEGPMLDGSVPCRRYAAHLVETEAGLQLIGFRDREGQGFGGYVMDPEPVGIEPVTGLLYRGG